MQKTYNNLGKLPPQAVDLEEAVLGALLLEKTPEHLYGLVKPEIFYKDAHQKICTAIIQLHSERAPIDLLTVTARLRKTGELENVGGAFYLTELTSRVASSKNTEYHLLIITQKYMQREMIRISSETNHNCYEDTADPFEEMHKLVSQVNKLQKKLYKRTEKNSTQLIEEIEEELLKENPDGLLGYTTGLKGLDYITHGDQTGSLRVVAAATSVGKTIELCSEVLNSCFDDKKQLRDDQTETAVFSLEMPSKQLTFRLISNLSSIENTIIKTKRTNDTERERLGYYFQEFKKAKIFIDDTPGLTIDEFESKAASLVYLHKVKKIYIDYYQLMKGDPYKRYGTREQELADISRRLKVCAKELDIAIIILAQIGQEVEKRHLYMPILSDLRECKALAHDADIVMFIWRPEYYETLIKDLREKATTINCQLFNININDFSEVCFFIIAKNRDGELGKIPFKFKGKIMRIYDYPLVIDAINNQGPIFSPEIREQEAPF